VSSPNLNPRVKRIPPRAEDLARYINDTIVYNLRVGTDEDITLDLPDIVALAHMITNETGTIPVREFGLDVVFVQSQ
jgi:hypothetical protein